MSFLKPGDTVCQLYDMDTSKGCLHLKARLALVALMLEVFKVTIISP